MKGLGVFLLPPGWDASPSQGYHSVGTHLYTWAERGTVTEKRLAQGHNTIQWPVFKPRLLAPELSALTMKPPCLPPYYMRALSIIVWGTISCIGQENDMLCKSMHSNLKMIPRIIKSTLSYTYFCLLFNDIFWSGAQQGEPLSSLIPWINPFPSRSIFRIASSCEKCHISVE